MKAKGVKPIIGCEVYVAPRSRFDKEGKADSSGHHLVLLCKDSVGYKNLCYLVSKSFIEGFYSKPRIDLDLLEECHEGLICLSGCISGRVPKALIRGQYELLTELIGKYQRIFGEDYYLEIQNHGIKEEKIVADMLPMYAKKHGIKVIATNDCHYLNSDDAEAHEWLLCLQTGKKLSDPNRMKLEGDYSVKSEFEMLQLFPDCPEAIYNTQEIVEKCNFDFTYGEYRMPDVVIPEAFGDDYYGYLESEAWKGYEKRYPVGHIKREEARPRLEYELGIIKQMGFAEYFLDTRKTIMWAHDHGIMTGVGRGSGAGSVMNYCLGITDIEPLKYNLLFEREKDCVH
jgi:DNA polymerase-3 subunit alpha